MVEVPRTWNGWPAIPPEQMTVEQLRYEANAWKHRANEPWTVGGAEYKKYADELKKRGEEL